MHFDRIVHNSAALDLALCLFTWGLVSVMLELWSQSSGHPCLSHLNVYVILPKPI